MPARPRSISRDGGGYFSFDRSDGSSQAVHQGVTDGSATIRPELGKLPHFRSVKRLACKVAFSVTHAVVDACCLPHPNTHLENRDHRGIPYLCAGDL
jgi:hypothetical protein